MIQYLIKKEKLTDLKLFTFFNVQIIGGVETGFMYVQYVQGI